MGYSGIAVLGAIFSSHGGYASGQDYVSGMTPAVYVGAVVVAFGAGAALLVPGRRRSSAAVAVDLAPDPVGALAVTGPSVADAESEGAEPESPLSVGGRRPLCTAARTTA